MGSAVGDLLGRAGSEHGGLVTEVAAKRVLAARGIATTLGTVAHGEDEAVAIAESTGWPVVAKVSSPDVLHKTETGGVRLHLRSPEEVRAAYREIVAAVEPLLGPGWDSARAAGQGVLVEPMATGFEFLVGATRSEFGPLVLVGLGGVLAELLRDVAHGLAPLTDADARRMLRSIRARAVFDSFRGTRAVSEDAVAALLLQVSGLLVDRPEIAELDLNPVMCSGDTVVVADARMVVAEPEAPPPERSAPAAMARLFSPASVAVVGATTGRYNRGRAWLRSVREAGFAGPLHAVSRKDRVDDFPTVGSLADLPETPDLVMVEVGRAPAREVLEECARMGVGWAVVHASGFGEDGTEEGREAGRWLQRFVDGGSPTRVVGPGALGPYSPGANLVPGAMSRRHGGVGLLSQSGVAFTTVGRMADARGFGVSHGVSYGSEVDAGVDDYLRFLAGDAGTEVIACYLEGVRRPTAFAGALREAAARKPVLLVKGGRSTLGARAAQSHSGALTAPSAAWEALCVQAGAFLLDDMEALVDGVVAFAYLRRLDGLGAAVVTPSGGWGVLFADRCAPAGVGLPELSEASRERLAGALPPGTSLRNPVDIGNAYFDLDAVRALLDALAGDPAVDVVAFHLAMDVFSATLRHAPWMQAAYVETLAAARERMAPTPLLVVMPHTVEDARREAVAAALQEAGIPVFSDVGRTLAAVRDVAAWTARTSGGGTGHR